MVHVSRLPLLRIAFISFPILVQAISPPVESPSADTDIICSRSDPTDCYPRVLNPTKDFQPIREGQDIPPGLHVRLNVYTGEKEARLNIPMEGEEGYSLEGLPTEQSVVVVEQPEADEIEEKVVRLPKNAPLYEAAGKIPQPPPTASDEVSTFQRSILSIQMEARGFDTALNDLLDLSHDIYYGVEIAKDGPVLERLICLTLGSGTERIPAEENDRQHKAASIIAASLQNNPTALKEVGEASKLVLYPTCAKGDFVSTLRNRLGREKEPNTLKAKVTAISGLLHEPVFRSEFLHKHGMELLLAIFLKKGEQWDGVRKKVIQLVMDNFLDESMGAELGIWPLSPVSESTICETKGTMLVDGCWEHHVAAFSKASPQAGWTREFLAAIKEQRKVVGGHPMSDREL